MSNKMQETSRGRLSAYAKRIRALREDNDMTQTQIADILPVGQHTYSDYELSYTRIPVDSLIKLAAYFDVDMNYICGLTDVKRPFPANREQVLKESEK